MSGILAVYALVISVLIASDIRPPPEKNYSLYNGIMHMAAGLSVGLPGLAAGYAIGIVGDVVCGIDVDVDLPELTLAGCACVHAPVEDLCGHGSDSHFRRSSGSLRVGLNRGFIFILTEPCRLIVALILNTRAVG